MLENIKEKEAFKRYREFYYEFPMAKEFVYKLLNKGVSTKEALVKMRFHFGMQYIKWKKQRGYAPSYRDYRVSKVYYNPKLRTKYFNQKFFV